MDLWIIKDLIELDYLDTSTECFNHDILGYVTSQKQAMTVIKRTAGNADTMNNGEVYGIYEDDGDRHYVNADVIKCLDTEDKENEFK